jgi:hypothetical protein
MEMQHADQELFGEFWKEGDEDVDEVLFQLEGLGIGALE